MTQKTAYEISACLVGSEMCIRDRLYVAWSRCGYPPDDEKKTGMKVVVNDTLLQGRTKEMGGVRDNKTEGVTTPNVVIKEIFM